MSKKEETKKVMKKKANKITSNNNSMKTNIKLKLIKTLNPFNIPIKNVHVFPNKNILILTDNSYKIYNEKHQCLRTKKDINYSNIKIIDNDTFICLKDNIKLIKINLKTGKVLSLHEFKEQISKILYHDNKLITTSNDHMNKITILERISETKYQTVTNIIFKEEEFNSINIFLIPEKNNLIISTNTKEGDCTYFYEFQKLKLINKLTDFYFEKIYKLNDNIILLLFGDEFDIDNQLNIYDLNQKKIVKDVFLKFNSNCEILIIPKKKVILVAGYIHTGFGSDREYKEIHVLNYDYEEIFVLNKIHYRSILGIELYEEKNEKEFIIITYSEDGAVNFLSLM